MDLRAGQRVRVPGDKAYRTIEEVIVLADGLRLYVDDGDGRSKRVELKSSDLQRLEVLREDGNADASEVLAGLWSGWMRAATYETKAAALGSTSLRPYMHQSNAVYGTMLPQPRPRFLLADEPGTGKTIMAGMVLREMQRLGEVRRCLIVAPAHLVPKWQADFERFFGGGLRRVYSTTAQEGPLRPDQDLWVVSLDLAAVNPGVQAIISPEAAGWDLVICDEAHRLTPTAPLYYRVGRMLTRRSPRVLLMTATPHRGKEWLFRSLMHLVDPDVFPEVVDESGASDDRLRPGRLHFLRRMKEDLVDYDGVTPLFRGRHAANISVPLNANELAVYNQALEMVSTYFPSHAVPLASMVYGKRAASSLYSLAQTLRRRREQMGTETPAFAATARDPDFEDAPSRDEATVIVEQSRAAAEEKKEIGRLVSHLENLLGDPDMPVSKWPRFEQRCLLANGIAPGNKVQAVVFTEYADTAEWLVGWLRDKGYSAEQYSGRYSHNIREATRSRFAAGDFQIIVSTDAGNEGIDLQSAHVLTNWDIPWSLVRLEQRMGRIHRIGQARDVELYNLIATDTREGEVLQVLLESFVTAANALQGKLFDSLSLVGEMVELDTDKLLAETYQPGTQRKTAALQAARAVTVDRLKAAAEEAQRRENALKSQVDLAAAVSALHQETLDRINPRIVEAYLARVEGSGHLKVRAHAAADGLYVIARPSGYVLPEALGGQMQSLVASSRAAIDRGLRAGAEVSDAISLGPGEPSFRHLVDLVLEECLPALFRGGTLTDPTTATDYDVVFFEAEVRAGGGRRPRLWPCLIRVDDTGARPLRWESLANLMPSGGAAAGLHPARGADADQRAIQVLAARRDAHRKALDSWLQTASGELQRLPSSLSADIEDPERRREARRRLQDVVRARLDDLEAMSDLELGSPRRLGWAHVKATGAVPDPRDMNSEAVSMALVARELRSADWAVADVHNEGRGYDLYAVKGRLQRCIEVKGVWNSATSEGIRMIGDEILVARQLRHDYWLCVVDHCSEGGRMFASYPDPAHLFAKVMRDVTVVRIPGSALATTKGEALAG